MSLQRRELSSRSNPLDAIFDPRVQLGNLVTAKCKVMNSKKVRQRSDSLTVFICNRCKRQAPLWLVFESAQPASGDRAFLFKVRIETSGFNFKHFSSTFRLFVRIVRRRFATRHAGARCDAHHGHDLEERESRSANDALPLCRHRC